MKEISKPKWFDNLTLFNTDSSSLVATNTSLANKLQGADVGVKEATTESNAGTLLEKLFNKVTEDSPARRAIELSTGN